MNSSTKAIVIGCGIIGTIGVIVIAAIVGWIGYAVQDVEDVTIIATGPTEVVAGETFDLTVSVTNERTEKVLALSDIDISQNYLGGFTVVRTTPATESTMTLPFDEGQSFTFSSDVPAQETRDFVFTLKAQVPGIYRGDVDVCEGTRFVTTMAQTVVTEAADPPEDNTPE